MSVPLSHNVQAMLNYYDPTDIRMRTYPYTIDAQLFNLAATAMDDLDMRYAREIDATFIETCPLQLDNRGLYYAAPLPYTFVPPPAGTVPPLNLVSGLRNATWTTLPAFDDRLGIPTRVTLDTTRYTVPLLTPMLVDWTSDGSIQKILTPNLTLPIPTKLTFWMEGATVPGYILILITGFSYPMSAWQKNQVPTSETLIYSALGGIQKTSTVWASVSSVVIRNAPSGVRVASWHIPFNLPAVADPSRPYTSPKVRDQTFNRYWQFRGPWLDEVYDAGPSVGMSIVTSYATPEPLLDLCVDDAAYTLLAVSSTRLHTIDRRALLPGRLNVTAITKDPVFSVNVVLDTTKTSTSVRYVRLEVLQHASNTTVNAFRFILEDPLGGVTCLDGSGNFITYSGGAAWTAGLPTEVSVPLSLLGTYVVTLEVIDTAGLISADQFPYPNLGLNVLSSLDLTSIVPQALAIARDSIGQLWIWTGQFAVPVQLHYDAYLFDFASNTVFLTDLFDQVSIS